MRTCALEETNKCFFPAVQARPEQSSGAQTGRGDDAVFQQMLSVFFFLAKYQSIGGSSYADSI